MPPRNSPQQKPAWQPPFFYGWVVVAVVALTLLIVFGIRLSFSVFFVALIDEFHWPRADTSLIFSVSMAVFALTSTPAGLALDRLGVRWTFGTGALLLSFGLLLSSRIETLPQLAVTYGVIAGLGITILGLGLQGSLVARWFRKRRGMAIGLAFAGTGLGSLILTPGVEYLISRVGWRGAYVTLAILAALLIPLIVFLLRLDPAQLGLFPDGEEPADAFHHSRSPRVPDPGWAFSDVIRAPAFWVLIVTALGAIGPLRLLTVHQLAAIVDAGFDRFFAATVIGAAGAVTAVAFIGFGTLSDKIGRRLAYALGSLCMLGAIGLLAFIRFVPSQGWLFLYALLLGMGEGSRSSLITAVASDLFPGQGLGAVNGAIGAAFGLGAALFPWLAGWLYDLNGDYYLPLAIAAGAVVLSTTMLWLAPRVTTERTTADPNLADVP